MRLRTAAAALVLAVAPLIVAVAPAQATAQRHCYITVKVTHNSASTTAKLVGANPCGRWFWPWGLFQDPGGQTQHDGPGVKSGSSSVIDNHSTANNTGGFKWSDSSGVVRQKTTY